MIVRIGSITTTLAPSARAASIVGHRWRLVRRVFVPHSRISRLWRSSSGSRPSPLPFVMRTPWPTVGPQIARSSRLAPRWWKNRPSRPITDSRLWLPASLNGRIASAAVAGDDVVEPLGDLGERVVPRDLLEPALALGPDPAQRVQQAVRAVDAIEEAVDLRAQLALAERVVGPPAQLDGDAVLDGDRPAARVRAVVVARAVDDAWSAFEHAGHATPPHALGDRSARSPYDPGP